MREVFVLIVSILFDVAGVCGVSEITFFCDDIQRCYAYDLIALHTHKPRRTNR